MTATIASSSHTATAPVVKQPKLDPAATIAAQQHRLAQQQQHVAQLAAAATAAEPVSQVPAPATAQGFPSQMFSNNPFAQFGAAAFAPNMFGQVPANAMFGHQTLAGFNPFGTANPMIGMPMASHVNAQLWNALATTTTTTSYPQ